MKRSASNLFWGALWGLGMAAWFSLIAAFLYAIATPRQRTEADLPLSLLIATYFGAGLVAGAVIGLLRPLGKWWWGAALMGTVGALVAALAFLLAKKGWITAWETNDFTIALTYGVLAGPAAGVLLWFRHRREARLGNQRKFGEGWYE